MLLNQACNSPKLKKLATILVCAGILICVMPLLPPVQNMVFSFFDVTVPRRQSGGSFEGRLRSLLSLPFFGLLAFVFAFCCLFSRTITAFLNNAKNTRLIVVLSAGTGALLLGYVSVFSYRHGWQWLLSDHGSEMLLGKHLAEENAFVSRNWYYSTELRLIYQTVFTMPLFKLLGHYENWALIRALNILLNNLVLALSYLYMARQMKIEAKWICITVLFLFLPLSYDYWDIVIFGGYYIFFIAQLFCCLGLFVRLAGNSGTVKKALPGFFLFTALSFALGVQGIRSLLNVHVPLLIACVCLFAMDAKKRKFPLFLGCYGFVVCCIGFVVNYLLHFWYNFNSFDSMLLEDIFFSFFPKLGQSLVCLAGFFGLSVGSSLLSAHGLLSVIAITGTFLLFRAVFRSFRQVQGQDDSADKSTEHQFLTLFFVVSVIFNIFVFIIIDEDIQKRYFIPFMVLYIPLAATIFQNTEKRYGHLKRTALVSGIALFIFGQSYLCFQSLAEWDINTPRKGYVQYLLDNRLEYGFASYANANVTTELSDGKIVMVSMYANKTGDPGKFFPLHTEILNWLMPAKYADPYYHEGESFLLLTRTEWELAQRNSRFFAGLPTDYEDSGFIIIRYPSTEAIFREAVDNP